jgi:hypothetical protein
LEVEDDNPEVLVDAEERIQTSMSEEYNIQQEKLNNIVDMLVDAQIPHIEVSCNRRREQVAQKLHKVIEEYLPPNRNSMFEKLVPISLQASANLLRNEFSCVNCSQ